MSGSRVVRLVTLVCVLAVVADIGLTDRLGLIFDTAFVLTSVLAAFAVRPGDFFAVGVLPPLLLAGLCAVLAVVRNTAIADRGDGFGQSIFAGLAQHSTALAAAYLLCLAVLAMRLRMEKRHARRVPEVARPQANRLGSPAPTLVTSGAPEMKSTTVVGEVPHSPESRTASTS